MKIGVTTMAYKRPQCFKESLISLLEQEHVNKRKYKLYVNLEYDYHPQVEKLAEEFYTDWDGDLSIRRWKNCKMGINKNAFDVVKRAFDEVDWVIYVEEDIVLSPDAFRLANWFIDNYQENWALLGFFNRLGKGDPAKLTEEIRFPMWGFVMNKDKWYELGKPCWRKGSNMWDNKMASYIRANSDYKSIMPDLSRSTNIGKEGQNMTKGTWNRLLAGHQLYQGSDKITYKLQ